MEPLRCLLLPTQGWTFILPCATIAEIVPYGTLKKITGTPEWLLGMFEWRGLMIPLLSLELINQSFATLPIPDRAHIAVLNRTEKESKLDYYAILLKGVPRMARFRAQDITLTTTCLEPQLSMEVEILDGKTFIPNIEWIEKQVNALPNLPQDIAKS